MLGQTYCCRSSNIGNIGEGDVHTLIQRLVLQGWNVRAIPWKKNFKDSIDSLNHGHLYSYQCHILNDKQNAEFLNTTPQQYTFV